MPVSPGEIVKTVATHVLEDNVITQSVWYHYADFTGDQTYAAVLAAMKTEIETLYGLLNSQISSATALTDLVCNKWEYNATEGWHTGALIGTDTLSDAFAVGTDAFPHIVAATITGFCQEPKTRTRKSIGGFVESTADDSDLLAAAVTALGNFLGEWLTARVISGAEELVPIIPQYDGTWEYLLYGLVSDILGSQRQRKPGVGI